MRPSRGSNAEASLLWFGDKASAEHAAIVNGALFEVLDFNDTYIPCFMHATSGVLPAALAMAEVQDCSGHALVEALAIAIEIELACATILMPTGYYRGFVPGGLVGGIGAAVACGLIAKLDDLQLRNALGLAMCSAFGTYESVGSSTLATIMGTTSRAGLVAAQLAALGIDAPATAFEGDKGMLASYSDEPAEKIETVLSTLGEKWRIHGQSYKTVPTETITHAPLDCLFALMPAANGRTVQRMAFGVEPIVVKIADERRARFGTLSSELQARFDTRFCAAAAWHRGRFTLAEMKEAAYTDPAILDLRSRIDLIADPSFRTFDGASLTITYDDGSTDAIRVDDFLGSPGQRLSDDAAVGDLHDRGDGPAAGRAHRRDPRRRLAPSTVRHRPAPSSPSSRCTDHPNETHDMTIAHLPTGESIWYRRSGRGALLLQIHGTAFGHRNFEKLTPLMTPHFEVIEFDLPGLRRQHRPAREGHGGHRRAGDMRSCR